MSITEKGLKALPIAVLAVILFGCATAPAPIVSRRILIVSNPPHATVSLIGEPTRLDTPCALDIRWTGRNFLRVEKDGFETSFVEITQDLLDRGSDPSSFGLWHGDEIPASPPHQVLRVTLKPMPELPPPPPVVQGPPPPVFQTEAEKCAKDLPSKPAARKKPPKSKSSTAPKKPTTPKAKGAAASAKQPVPPPLVDSPPAATPKEAPKAAQ